MQVAYSKHPQSGHQVLSHLETEHLYKIHSHNYNVLRYHLFCIAIIDLQSILPTALEPECQTDPADRTECGYFGISAQQCKENGCCWNPTSSSGRPWCFTKPTPPTCKLCMKYIAKNATNVLKGTISPLQQQPLLMY